MSKTNPARGMRDFLPADVRKREYVIGIIKEVYESYGFEPLETPAVENLETLMGKYGEEGNQLIFKILKRGEKLAEVTKLQSAGGSDSAAPQLRNFENSLADLALRYDLTVPLARVVADRKNDLPKFFKRYQIQPVWRADRPARGRFREFYQCDVDAIGSSSMLVEAELISAVSNILGLLGFRDFVIRLNSRPLLEAYLSAVGVPQEIFPAVVIAIDKLDKIGADGVRSELIEKGLNPTWIEDLLNLFGRVSERISNLDKVDDGSANRKYNDRFLSKGKETLTKKGISFECLTTLQCIINFLAAVGADQHVRLDPSLARGLSYYTGAIFEINVPDLAGSLGGGGRYDGLIGMFGKEQIPACGFSLGLERILVVMEERGMFPPDIAESTPADVMVTIWSEETIAESIKLAAELRSAGLRVTVYPEPDKLGKQMKYADQIRVPYVCVLGETEIAEGRVTLKDMKSGEQESLELNDVQKKLKV